MAEKNAFVTGGASGIGRAICLRLARDGANVVVCDLDASGAKRVAEEVSGFGRRALAVEADVASFVDVSHTAQRMRREIGPVAILVHAAGIGDIAPLTQMTEAQWDRMIAVHLKGSFNCARAVAEDMIQARWGRMVFISSVAGIGGAAGFVHYSAAKAGIIGFTKALALELSRTGVTVNAIAPGLIDTPILQKAGVTAQTIEALVERSPVGRIGVPDDIAAAAAYVVSDEASFLTGQVISPNGGIRT